MKNEAFLTPKKVNFFEATKKRIFLAFKIENFKNIEDKIREYTLKLSKQE